ncbi:hypothetical protein AC52_4246 [Escherichia coli 5-366-08_S3_C3]|nr:hypothetical protein AC52_4246 [Escherichia coli 5-366-08_S3_C3]KEL90759.1 hypothetical protein AB94_3892 [Escherichia coli 5-366-08_S3_C1]
MFFPLITLDQVLFLSCCYFHYSACIHHLLIMNHHFLSC